MDRYYLQLNTGKTQIMVVGPPNILKNIQINGVILSSTACIRFVPVVKNLGIYMDNSLKFHQQVMNIKKSCFMTIRNICKIRYLLSNEQLQVVVNSLVVSCLDYCNALYFDINDSDLRQLQLIQNAAARCVFKKYKHDHLEDDIKQLHWLTVDKRIIFKILLLVFKSLVGFAPVYLQELLSYKSFGYDAKLQEPATYSSYGKRAFSVVGPKIWNKLPKVLRDCTEISKFKKSLKTFLFGLSYYDVKCLIS